MLGPLPIPLERCDRGLRAGDVVQRGFEDFTIQEGCAPLNHLAGEADFQCAGAFKNEAFLGAELTFRNLHVIGPVRVGRFA